MKFYVFSFKNTWNTVKFHVFSSKKYVLFCDFVEKINENHVFSIIFFIFHMKNTSFLYIFSAKVDENHQLFGSAGQPKVNEIH